MPRPVVLVTSFPIPHVGGASGHFELLGRELRRRGLLAGRVTGSDASPWIGLRAAAALGVRAGWERPRATLLLRTVRRLARLLERQAQAPGTLFHCHDPLASCAALQARRPGDAVVQTVHGPLSREVVAAGYRPGGAVERTLNDLERSAFGRVGLLLPVDGGQGAILKDEFGVPGDRVRVIRNAIDFDEINRLSAGESRIAIRRDTFLVPRRLVRKNGVEIAIRALAHEDAAAFRLVIAGDGPDLGRLKRIARKSGVTRRVRFLGSVAHAGLLPIMRSACGVVVPSVPFGGVVEATSLSVLEAMAAGAPVIGSDLGGIAEIITSPDLGVLVRPGDSEGIARAMKAVWNLDAGERAGRIESAREHVRKKFGVSRWMTEILGAYEAAEKGDDAPS